MHTFQAPGGTVFNFNSDLSGDLQIKGPGPMLVGWIPAADLLAFFSHITRLRAEEMLETADKVEVIPGPGPSEATIRATKHFEE